MRFAHFLPQTRQWVPVVLVFALANKAVDRSEKLAGLVVPTPIVPEPR
jgi:hypothetical protein